jgi:hypothetical protein
MQKRRWMTGRRVSAATSRVSRYRWVFIAPAVVALQLLVPSCARPTPRTTLANPSDIDVARLWQAPIDLAERNLFHGAGAAALTPDPAVAYTFVKEDRSGYSDGYDVRGPSGLWSVKLGLEAQPEVVASRVLWAIGYHQPPTYYVERWTMVGGQSGPKGPARFRPELPDRKVIAEWSWYENDLVGTQPFNGLIVANLILNNWDWKTSNNKVYELAASAGAPSRRVYVVQDLGASLGKTTFPALLKWFPVRGFGQGSRNDLEGFESQGLIRNIEGERVEFDYRGIHGSLLKTLTPRDVLWTCELMARLSDAQWVDAFRAAGYSDDQTRRYVAKIKAKINEGRALAGG